MRPKFLCQKTELGPHVGRFHRGTLVLQHLTYLDSLLLNRPKEVLRRLLAPLLYRYPPCSLQPERLYRWLHAVIETRETHGAVVEIGCMLGGTAAITKRMMDNLGIKKRYVCIDTFDGFVAEQFDADVTLGTPKHDKRKFSGSSPQLVTKVLNQHHCFDVELIQADITCVNEDDLPEACSLVLADVDLVEPTYAALAKFWPRISPGGMILVDDCPEATSWKARLAYARFCNERSIPERYDYGFGVLVKGINGQ